MQYILFNDLASFNTWHEKIKKDKMIPFKGTTSYTEPIFHPDVLDKRVICQFDNTIPLTGLTVISEDQAKAYGWFNYEELAAKAKIQKRLDEAKKFGQTIIDDVTTENIYNQYTSMEVMYIAQKLSKIQMLLLSGSLYLALAELEAMQAEPPLLAKARIDRYIYRIRSFLGLPLNI
jgi:hypothetical protein